MWWFVRLAIRFVLENISKAELTEEILSLTESKRKLYGAVGGSKYDMKFRKQLDALIDHYQKLKDEKTFGNFVKRNFMNLLMSMEPSMYKNLKWNGIIDLIKGDPKGFKIMKENTMFNLTHGWYYDNVPPSIRNTIAGNKKYQRLQHRMDNMERTITDKFETLQIRNQQRIDRKIFMRQKLQILKNINNFRVGESRVANAMLINFLKDMKEQGYEFYDVEKFAKNDIDYWDQSTHSRNYKRNVDFNKFNYSFFPISFGVSLNAVSKSTNKVVSYENSKNYKNGSLKFKKNNTNEHFSTGNFNRQKWIWNSETCILRAFFRSEMKDTMGKIAEYRFKVPTFEEVELISRTLTMGTVGVAHRGKWGKGGQITGTLAKYRI